MAIDLESIAEDRERIRREYLRGATDRPASSARGIHHTALLSSDVRRTIEFYQGLLDDRAGIWDPAVLADATAHVRCTMVEPIMGVPVNRTVGLVVAGDDGLHVLRYAIFGEACSPRAFGHAGAHAQVGWADPETGISFAYLNNAVTDDMLRAGIRAHRLASLAAALDPSALRGST